MLTVEDIVAADPGPWGDRLTVLESTGSTNDDLLARAKLGAPTGTTILADAQHAGRGRIGRAWHSPVGVNLYLSVLLRAPKAEDLARLPPLSLVAGLAVVEALDDVGVTGAGLKWPNDVLIDGLKVCGVLTEATATPSPALVVGVGLNVNQRAFPPELSTIATSLALVAGRDLDRAVVAARLLRRLESRLTPALGDGLEEALEAWSRRSCTLGRLVACEGGPTGRAVAVATDGALVVEDAAGRRHRVVGGIVRVTC